MTARRRPAPGPSPDAAALAAAVAEALTVPEPADDAPPEAWDRYERILRYRGTYVRTTLADYAEDTEKFGLEFVLELLAGAANGDARLFEPPTRP